MGQMKMKKLLWGLVIVVSVLFIGNQESFTPFHKAISFNEVEKEEANQDVASFIQTVQEKNGAHLYFDRQNAIYVYLNEAAVEVGVQPVSYTDFSVEEDGDTLNVLYRTEGAALDSDKPVKFQRLYKIQLNKAYENVIGFRNGEEEPFAVVSGN
ncbi:hypothetical protein M3202_00420 [Alkalihalobacillus oceani]|uniref:Uncharacterized protein n=1 Tax=Halalkalibacter oceani TaxID=1653776 RepID=A0A9X2DL97_9BACI|nr:hypothetical protein [Halalkalibacter oceani]MCM3712531.1 hypothetical protein [Halalkalibacter oceani]